MCSVVRGEVMRVPLYIIVYICKVVKQIPLLIMLITVLTKCVKVFMEVRKLNVVVLLM